VHFLEQKCTIDDPGLVNDVVITELVWVLESVYRYTRQQVSILLGALFRTDQLALENSDDARAALREYQDSGDFADALIATVNRRLGCEHTATFDRKAARRPGFLAL
jgi:predicted nucleic-acid-binding protein